MESSLAMRLRSVERVIELKADFQTAAITNQTLNRKGFVKTEKGMRKNCVSWLFGKMM